MVDVIEAIRRQSREHPTSMAVAGGECELSYRELIELIDSEALQLSRTGHRTIAIAADNGPGWIVCDLAARIAGLTVVPLPAFFSVEQCSHVISDARVEAVVLDRAGESTLGHLIDEYHDAACGLRLARIRQADRLCSAPRPAKLSYTSGTTGTPKGVELSWVAMNRVANAISYVTQPLQISRHTCLLPFGLLLENVAGVYAALISGATVVCPSISAAGTSMTGFVDGRRILQTLAQTRADSAIMLPQLLEATVEALESGFPCPALSFVAVGGAKTPEAVMQRARAAGLPVFEGYGLTECGSVVCLNVPGIDRAGSVGRPLPHAHVRLASDGELVVSGAVFDGYRGEQRRAHREVCSGDIGSIDSDGFVFIRGRKKNVFVTSFGRNVSPEWVEAALCSSPYIRHAAVYGENKPWNVAVIVPPVGGTTKDRIVAAVRDANQSLPAYARIGAWVIAQDGFSAAAGLLTPNGRMLRDAIYARFADKIAACYDTASDTHTRRLRTNRQANTTEIRI